MELPQLTGFYAGAAGMDLGKKEKQERKPKKDTLRRAVRCSASRGRRWGISFCPVAQDWINRQGNRLGTRPAGSPFHTAIPAVAGVRRRGAAGRFSWQTGWRVRAERLYFIPEGLPDLEPARGGIQASGWGRSKRSVSSRRIRWRCSCNRDRPGECSTCLRWKQANGVHPAGVS